VSSKKWGSTIKPLRVDPKVLIAIVAHEQSRYTKFWSSLLAVVSSTPNTVVSFHVGNQLAKCRNDAIAKAEELSCDYVWFIDDDHEFPPDILNRLLATGKSIIGPLYCIRGYPFDPTARVGDDHRLFNVTTSGEPGPKAVSATGTSGLLIHRSVWQSMERPWFAVGHNHPELIAEDFFFCEKARAHGHTVWVDTSNILEHFATMKCSFERQADGSWRVIIDAGRNFRVGIPYTFNTP